MAYTPDPNNAAQPADATPRGTAAAEFRALKQRINDLEAALNTADTANSNAITQEISDRQADVQAEEDRAVAAENVNAAAITQLSDDTATAITQTVTDIKNTIFHVGALFVTKSNSDPATILGMPGTTWARIAKGKGVVSRDPIDPVFSTAGGSVGNAGNLVTIAAENLPAHNHPITDKSHDHSAEMRNTKTVGEDGGLVASETAAGTGTVGQTTGASFTGITGTENNVTENNAIDVRNDAVIFNMWERTA